MLQRARRAAGDLRGSRHELRHEPSSAAKHVATTPRLSSARGSGTSAEVGAVEFFRTSTSRGLGFDDGAATMRTATSLERRTRRDADSPSQKGSTTGRRTRVLAASRRVRRGSRKAHVGLVQSAKRRRREGSPDWISTRRAAAGTCFERLARHVGRARLYRFILALAVLRIAENQAASTRQSGSSTAAVRGR